MDKNIAQEALVSVIMPAYNAEKFIEESIRSVQAQIYTNWELIIIDDGSTDDTASIVKKLQLSDCRITYFFQENKRLGSARNSGLKLARGAWITFLDSDDLWMEEKMQKQMLASKNKDIDIIITSGYYLHTNSNELMPYDSLSGYHKGNDLYKDLINHNMIPALSVCFRKDLIVEIGIQDINEIVHGSEDWDYWLRACKVNAVFWGLEERLFKYRVHQSAMSSNRVRMLTASYYVVSKNYDSTLLDENEQHDQKARLFYAIPFLAKRMLKSLKVQSFIDHSILIFKILLISYPLIPVAIFKAIRKSLRLIA